MFLRFFSSGLLLLALLRSSVGFGLSLNMLVGCFWKGGTSFVAGESKARRKLFTSNGGELWSTSWLDCTGVGSEDFSRGWF